MQLAWARLCTGRLSTLPTPKEALAHSYSPADHAAVAAYRQLQIIGDPAAVRGRIEQLLAPTAADEVMITVVHDPAARARSYELLAHEFGLAPRRD